MNGNLRNKDYRKQKDVLNKLLNRFCNHIIREQNIMSMNESYSSYEKLLMVAAKISDRYDEIYRITGENFNVFQVLDV